ncbi:hypothetical protein B6D52_03780 [Candidatus Parcubacteria bacterium 4484_255]|nr:MAG: hypothetical protein B6D52_03780 [Candidatus Parcubacteria bacterium 4484_255]
MPAISKIIFVKIRDEKKGRKNGEYYDFQIKTHEPAESVYKRINNIYEEAREKDPEIFKENLKVEPEELYTVVEHLLLLNNSWKISLKVKAVNTLLPEKS